MGRSGLVLVAAFLVLSGLLGCGAAATPPLTPETQAELDQAAQLGRAIFEQDEVSAHASDALLASLGQPPPRLSGWITRGSQGGWTTSFVTVDGGGISVIDEVRLGVGTPPTVATVEPPRPIDPEGAAMFRAQAVARSVVHGKCGDSYNPVVLPATLVGKDGWLVYLLAASTQKGARVLAGHHRVLVSSDGNQILEHTPLSKSCIVAPPDPSGRSGASMVSSLVGDYPSEAHFFTSMHYGMPLYVVMANGTVWKVGRTALRIR